MKECLCAALLFPVLAMAQAAPTPPAAADKAKADAEKNKEEIEQGIPVTSEAVQKACGACHKSDEKQRMTRISYRRTTPEGWQETIKRMVALNGVRISPQQAREVVKYLANHHGLAPEEARPAAFEVERRMIDYTYTADRDTEQTCIKCHSMGRVITQRRTKGDWELLIAMHRGFYPLSDFQAFRRGGPPRTEPGPDGRPPDNRHPMDKAVAHLSGALPLKTPEWSAWSANMRAPKLEGRWALSGWEPGKGPVYGEVTVRPGDAAEEFTTEARYTYARTGQTVTRKGKTIVYTGFQWRGRSFEGSDESKALREVMFVDRAWREVSGRWFTGAYDEFGLDVKLTRIGADPVVSGAEPFALKQGSRSEVTVYGANLAGVSSVDFGPGIQVHRVISAAADRLRAEVEVAKDALIGTRDIFATGALRAAGVVVYDKVDILRVRPQAGMARIGGLKFPKQYQQFEAVGYAIGPDGKPDTKDDVFLGVFPVTWSIEEFAAVFGDDDKDFVGSIDQNGLFTPNVDGPNPKRKNNTNNYGDVWVVATYTPPAAAPPSGGNGGNGDAQAAPKPIRARAHLLVTVPLYMKFDTPEVTP